MKIITWNACCKFREKYSLLSQYDADILVIQECEDPSRSLCQAYRAFSGQYVWVGANKNKGLGIFCKPGLQMDSLNWESRSLSYFLPVRINDSFDLIGVWACKPHTLKRFTSTSRCIIRSSNPTAWSSVISIATSFRIDFMVNAIKPLWILRLATRGWYQLIIIWAENNTAKRLYQHSICTVI